MSDSRFNAADNGYKAGASLYDLIFKSTDENGNDLPVVSDADSSKGADDATKAGLAMQQEEVDKANAQHSEAWKERDAIANRAAAAATEGKNIDPIEASQRGDVSSPVASQVAAPEVAEVPALTFKEKFAAARKANKASGNHDNAFEWNGKKITTWLHGEKPVAAQGAAKPVAPAAVAATTAATSAPAVVNQSASTDATTPFYSRAQTAPVGNSLANQVRRPIKPPEVFVPKQEFHYEPNTEPVGNSLARRLSRGKLVAGPAPTSN